MSAKVYTVHYRLKNAEGNTVDTSVGGEPMVFLEGSKQVIPGIDQAVRGREVGACLEVTIPPELAYGQHNPDLVSEVPLAQFDGVTELKAGMKFQTQSGEGAQVVKVVEVLGDCARVDANHPLAGLTLVFELELVAIRAATEGEIKSGAAVRE